MALCKTMLDNYSDEELFSKATERFRHYDVQCPGCGSPKLSPYTDYSRGLISYEKGNVVDRIIWAKRFVCKSCGSTHALLPDILTPYSAYSLRFKLTVLIAYYERDTTVAAVCERFCIAISTLYAWKDRLLEHKELFLGMLTSNSVPAVVFLRRMIKPTTDLSILLRSFFRRYSFSFLQNRSMSATQNRPP